MSVIRAALNNYARSQEKVWQTDRSQTIGASEIGQCARKVYWLKNESDPQHAAQRDPDHVDGWGARMRGTVYENHFWEPALRAAYGERLRFAGTEQKTFVSGFLSATPDGLLTGLQPGEVEGIDGPDANVECKTADPRTNLTEAKAENVYQTHVQMGLVRELTPFKPTHSILSYTDASFWNEGREFIIPFDPSIFAAAKARAATIMTATHPADLKPEGWIAGGRECEYCPFTKACGVQRRSLIEQAAPLDPQFVAELSDLARDLKSFESARDQAETRVRELQHGIKERLQAKGQRRIVGAGVSITWSAVKGRPSWDNKALREAFEATGADLTPFSTVGEPTDRLTVKVSDSTSENPQAAA